MLKQKHNTGILSTVTFIMQKDGSGILTVLDTLYFDFSLYWYKKINIMV